MRGPPTPGWWLDEASTWHPRGAQQIREVLLGACPEVLQADFEIPLDQVARVTARTFLIHGDRDEFIPLEVPLELYEAIPDARLWIVPNASHAIFFFCYFAPAEACAGGGDADAMFPMLAKQFFGDSGALRPTAAFP